MFRELPGFADGWAGAFGENASFGSTSWEISYQLVPESRQRARTKSDDGGQPDARRAGRIGCSHCPGTAREHRAGRLAEAAAAYRKILALRPDIAEAHNDLGNVLLSQGKLDEAAAQYERALALKPGLFQAHNNLGCIFQVQGKLDRAVAQFERAIALRPDYAEAQQPGQHPLGAGQARPGPGTV